MSSKMYWAILKDPVWGEGGSRGKTLQVVVLKDWKKFPEDACGSCILLCLVWLGDL